MKLKLFIAKHLYGFNPNCGEPLELKQIKQEEPKLEHVSRELRQRYIRYKVEKFNDAFKHIRSQI